MASSPVVIRQRGTLVEIESRATGEVLAHCRIGDDDNLERIADLLSCKKLSADAMKLRQMAMDARHPQRWR